MKYERKVDMKKIKPYEKCLACGSTDMYFAHCGATNMFSQVCNECHTIHQLGIIIPGEVIKTEHEPDDIDDTLMDIEYEVGNLPRYATNKNELEYLERIRNIFDELISVIRRMKQ